MVCVYVSVYVALSLSRLELATSNRVCLQADGFTGMQLARDTGLRSGNQIPLEAVQALMHHPRWMGGSWAHAKPHALLTDDQTAKLVADGVLPPVENE